MGLLSLTVRVQVVPLSSLPTQSCCHVEWAEAVAAAARRMVAYFMIDDRWLMREGLGVSDCVVYYKSKAEDWLYLFLILNPHVLLASDKQSNSSWD